MNGGGGEDQYLPPLFLPPLCDCPSARSPRRLFKALTTLDHGDLTPVSLVSFKFHQSLCSPVYQLLQFFSLILTFENQSDPRVPENLEFDKRLWVDFKVKSFAWPIMEVMAIKIMANIMKTWYIGDHHDRDNDGKDCASVTVNRLSWSWQWLSSRLGRYSNNQNGNF